MQVLISITREEDSHAFYVDKMKKLMVTMERPSWWQAGRHRAHHGDGQASTGHLLRHFHRGDPRSTPPGLVGLGLTPALRTDTRKLSSRP